MHVAVSAFTVQSTAELSPILRRASTLPVLTRGFDDVSPCGDFHAENIPRVKRFAWKRAVLICDGSSLRISGTLMERLAQKKQKKKLRSEEVLTVI